MGDGSQTRASCKSGTLPPIPGAPNVGEHGGIPPLLIADFCQPGKGDGKCCCAPPITKTVSIKKSKITHPPRALDERQDISGQHLCGTCSLKSLQGRTNGQKCCLPRLTHTVTKTIR